MRLSLLLILLTLCRAALAQPGASTDSARPGASTPGTFRIDSIPAAGLPFMVAWRWHAGDNPQWASPAFDDSRWDTIRPDRGISRFPQVTKAGNSWFRQTLVIGPAVANQPLPLFVFLNGAAELYLDGKKFANLGQVGTSAQTTVKYKRARGDLFMLPGLPAGRHVLAARFATYPNPWYIPRLIEEESTFRVEIDHPGHFAADIAQDIHAGTLQKYLIAGLFLMLAAIHFLYYTYRRQPINLIFGTTMLLSCLSTVANDLPPYLHNLTLASWSNYAGTLFGAGFAVMLLATYYSYLQHRRGLIFGILAGFTLLIASAYGLPHLSRPMVVGLTLLRGFSLFLLFADGFRISMIAIRDKRYNAVVVLISVAVVLGLVVVGAIVVGLLQYAKLVNAGISGQVLASLLSVSIPVVLAVLLAREHDQTSRDLQSRLADVEKLSAEKEAILTQQTALLEQQVAQRTAKLNQSLQDLRDTQSQLVQREKMASLGELTAGIAHEIQNPLNFVNNFSDVSAELLDELKQEQARPADERDLELEAELLGDIHQNVGKINQHGQRAAGIVRGMLQHSRTSTGEKEPTDLNALGDEYLRLSYHGVRAKDKVFNATLHTSLDPNLLAVKVVSQDIGRVLLNLFNNAFYAVRERAKTQPDTYHPTVWLITKQHADHLEIRVQDNGSGNPEAVQRKIFQPFFTTKPTGEGTGLGLSLSYDIITKGHRGTLAVETTPGEQTTFIITLPTA